LPRSDERFDQGIRITTRTWNCGTHPSDWNPLGPSDGWRSSRTKSPISIVRKSHGAKGAANESGIAHSLFHSIKFRFGDTMNTGNILIAINLVVLLFSIHILIVHTILTLFHQSLASRMESTGQRNKIQLSGDTAEILTKAGHADWVTRRSDRVQVKGKTDAGGRNHYCPSTLYLDDSHDVLQARGPCRRIGYN